MKEGIPTGKKTGLGNKAEAETGENSEALLITEELDCNDLDAMKESLNFVSNFSKISDAKTSQKIKDTFLFRGIKFIVNI